MVWAAGHVGSFTINKCLTDPDVQKGRLCPSCPVNNMILRLKFTSSYKNNAAITITISKQPIVDQ